MVPIVYVFGALHNVKEHVLAIEKDIKKVKANIILHDLLYEDVCRNKTDIQSRLNTCRHRAICDPRINKHIYQLGYDIDAKLVGVGNDDPRLHRMPIYRQFHHKEMRLFRVIKEYVDKDYDKPTVIVIVVDDVHLRSKRAGAITFVSPLHDYFKRMTNIIVKRVPMGLREMP